MLNQLQIQYTIKYERFWTMIYEDVRFQVLTAASMKTFFWDIVLCIVVKIYRRLKGTYCLHHKDPALLFHIQKVTGSNRGPEAGYPN
jgi:hypothetical protein